MPPPATAALPDRLVRDRTPSLKEVRGPVADELGVFRQYFREAMRSPVGLLDKVTQYVLRTKGKELRPVLVLLSAQLCGGVTEKSYRAAALVELLHTAT
ncbi:MAG: polyprenyl synthetase family protein, partial [Rhodothermales bacterium]|nr:polyprenyl synthetase family protein [Rhodothermales bacterium]